MVHRSDYTPENPKYAIKEQTLRAYLTALAPYVRRTPVRAKINLGSSSDYSGLSAVHVSSPVPLKVIQGHPGATLDIEGSINEIDKIVIEHPTQTHIVLALHTISPPKLDAIFDKLSARLAHYVTHFNPGEVGRTETVRRAISLVDGKVVQPGEIFSINETVGERTAARGFGIGFVFVDGHLDKQLGGGMCQVATTLYNAVLLAHLKVIERHAHARTVPYVEPGQDATVYWGSKDFKFQNDTDSPIYISYRTTATHAICDLYGKYVPGLKVRTVDTYERLGQRHFTSRFRRYTTLNGKTTVDYESYSDYNWTPALDYTM
jgi:vancomycin resistance protein YoaR